MANDDKDDLIDSVKSLFGDERSPEQKILDRRDRKRSAFRIHRNAYLVVNGGFALLNLVIYLTFGWTFPFFLFPAVFWGMGFAMHGLSYRSWTKAYAGSIAEAERKLGRLPPGVAYKSLPAPKNAPVIEGTPIRDSGWIHIIAKAKEALARAHQALDGVDQSAASTDELRTQLDEGYANIQKLAAGAERISEALTEIAPDGGAGLDREIERIDQKIEGAEPQLEEVLGQNREMLVARKEKVDALRHERERMKANAEGFVLAAENVRLDVANLSATEAPKAEALAGPAKRLTEEVEIMRKVEAELKQFSV